MSKFFKRMSVFIISLIIIYYIRNAYQPSYSYRSTNYSANDNSDNSVFEEALSRNFDIDSLKKVLKTDSTYRIKYISYREKDSLLQIVAYPPLEGKDDVKENIRFTNLIHTHFLTQGKNVAAIGIFYSKHPNDLVWIYAHPESSFGKLIQGNPKTTLMQ